MADYMYAPGGMPEDDRPVICTCSACGSEIHGKTRGIFGEAFYDFTALDGAIVHVDCLTTWARSHDRDGSKEDSFCEICEENQKNNVHFVLDGKVICENCLDEWAEDYLDDSNV